MTQPFSFKPLQESDLNLLCHWFSEPHVKEWWNDHLTDDEIKSKYKKRIGDTIVAPFIAYLDDRPIGFIQYYQADKVGEGWWPDEVEGTIGIDQFIGEGDLINLGIGTKMIRAFIDDLFCSPDVKKIITDVDPKNLRAIRCYEKVGFEFVKEIVTPDGLAYLMVMNKNKLSNPEQIQEINAF
jgi:RimJ/RimL family protein N-acetyltransferase